MASQLEDQIEAYTYEHFDASQAAQHIFAAYSESEVTRKLNEMTVAQQLIESVLKQEVKRNYSTFLQATDQIQQVGQDMAELKLLIENTQSIISDVQQTKISDSRAMRSNSLLPAMARSTEEAKSSMNSRSEEDALPAWLEKAPNELAQYIVEQQYQKAVAIVLQARQFAESTQSLTLSERASDALQLISERGVLLADTLKRSLLALPNSPLWGRTEQHKRLTLLITLREYAQAAEGFSLLQEQSMQRALSAVETSTDVLFYAEKLSRSFFSSLLAALSLYHSLFSLNTADLQTLTSTHTPPQSITRERGEIVWLLVQWSQRQISLFVAALCRQCALAVNESAMLWVIHLRDLSQWRSVALAASLSPNATTQRLPSSDENNNESVRESPMKTPRGRPRRQSILIPQALATTTENSPRRNSISQPMLLTPTLTPAMSVSRPQQATAADEPLGGLFLLSRTLSSAFACAKEHEMQLISTLSSSSSQPQRAGERETKEGREGKNALSLPLVAFFSCYSLTEVKQMTSAYIEEFVRDAVTQVRQEAWTAIRAPSLTVRSVLLSAEDRESQREREREEEGLVALSYTWMVSAFDHLLLDISVLLNSDPNNPNAYDRTDVCEVEPVAVSGLLRLLLRFVIEIESIDSAALSQTQLQCCLNTVKAIANHLIPSLQRAMDKCFYSERLQLMSIRPSNVLKTTTQRLVRFAQEMDTLFQS